MGEWKEHRLGDFVEVVNGFAFKSENFLPEKKSGVLPVIKIKNVANGDVHLDGCQYHLYDSSLANYVIEKSDILIALTGNHPEVTTQVVGEVSKFKINEKALLNQRVAKIVAKNGLDADFIYYYLKEDSIHEFLASQSAGSANQANISKKDIENVRINLPPLPEQKVIAEVLSSLDDKIDLLHRQNKTLESLAETLFRQWFIEEPNSKWEERSLDGIAEFLNGLACQKYPRKLGEVGLPVIKIRELRAGFSDASDVATADVPEKYIVNDGDILFSWSGSLEVVIWTGGKGVLNQHLFKVTSDQFPEWFYYFWIKQHLVDFRGVADDKATTMGHIQRHHLTGARVTVPSPDEVIIFNATLDPMFQKIKANHSQIVALTKSRDALLPKLMTGTVRV